MNRRFGVPALAGPGRLKAGLRTDAMAQTAFHEPHEFRSLAIIKSGGGPPHSKTLARWPQSRALPPGFGVRQSCGALAMQARRPKSEHSGNTLNDKQPGSINIRGTTAMKNRHWQMGILALSLILSVAGCGKDPKPVAASTNAPAGSVDKLKEQARNAVTTTKDYLAQQKDRWQKAYSDKLSEFDKRLADLKAKSGDKARSEWNKALSQLEQKKESAAQKLEQLKNAGTDRWQEVRTNAEIAFADLEKSFKDTFSRFKNDDKSAK